MKKDLKKDWPLYLIILVVGIFGIREILSSKSQLNTADQLNDEPDHWVAPSIYTDNSLTGEDRKMVIYGEELIANTAQYLGPNGSVNQISNGMNCQNCHLDAGRRPWGNNYSAVASTYPKLRGRSGMIEGIPKRVNDCFERSLNGQAIDTTGYEMKSIVAYIKWLGKDVPKGESPKSVGITSIAYLDREASPAKGQIVFTEKCVSCHGADGEGLKALNDIGYAYPPLWGKNSYNSGAGLYRLSRFAGYVKDNMPFNQATHKAPVLTDEEAWDVAAYVNSQPRPSTDISKDYPNIADKPIDHPFGPYADGFSEEQHKYGPFKPIAQSRKALKGK